MKIELFTLKIGSHPYVPSLVQFRGVEYANIRVASETIVGQYGFYHALGIIGRAFVLTNEEFQKFLTHEIPFAVGISNGENFISFRGKFRCDTSHFQWVYNVK